jgi:hypothetical protein
VRLTHPRHATGWARCFFQRRAASIGGPKGTIYTRPNAAQNRDHRARCRAGPKPLRSKPVSINQSRSGLNENVVWIDLRRMELLLEPTNVTGVRWRRLENETRRKPAASERFKMSAFSASYVSRVLFATPALGCVASATARRWRRLAAPLFDPYRPEMHYMRGPGPKWREKHARDAG